MKRNRKKIISIIYIIIYLISITFNLSLNSDLIQSIRQIDNYVEMLNNPIVIIVNIITEIQMVYMRKKGKNRRISAPIFPFSQKLNTLRGLGLKKNLMFSSSSSSKAASSFLSTSSFIGPTMNDSIS